MKTSVIEEKITFSNGKGIKLVGTLRNPTNKVSSPIIILCHGFLGHKDRHSMTMFSDILGENKISTFRFDFYGHGESGGKLKDITVTEGARDILSAINYLKSNGYNKIGLLGTSFGGLASIMATSKNKNLFLLALKSPVSNYEEQYKEKLSSEVLSSWRRLGYRIYVRGDGTKKRIGSSFLKDIENNDGYKAAEKIKIPTIIVHGKLDEEVPYQHSVKTSKIIRNCKLLLIPRANHHIDNPAHYKLMLKVITDFIIENSK